MGDELSQRVKCFSQKTRQKKKNFFHFFFIYVPHKIINNLSVSFIIKYSLTN